MIIDGIRAVNSVEGTMLKCMAFRFAARWSFAFMWSFNNSPDEGLEQWFSNLLTL